MSSNMSCGSGKDIFGDKMLKSNSVEYSSTTNPMNLENCKRECVSNATCVGVSYGTYYSNGKLMNNHCVLHKVECNPSTTTGHTFYSKQKM